MSFPSPDKYCLTRFELLLNPISNPEDSSIYAGRDELRQTLEKRITRAKIVSQKLHTILWGPYGSGKTHTLHYIKHYLLKSAIGKRKPEVYFLVCPAFVKKTFVELYTAIIKELGKKFLLDILFNCYEILEKELSLRRKNDDEKTQLIHEKIGNRDVASVMLNSVKPGSDDYLIWKWFSGEPCSVGDKKSLFVLGDNSNSETAINTLTGLIQMYEIANEGKKLLVVMIDELENLTGVKGSQQDFMHAFRTITEHNAFAFFGAYTAHALDAVPVFSNSAVRQRIGYPKNYIEIKVFTQDDAKKFVAGLLKQMRPKGSNITKRISECKQLTSEKLSQDFFPFTEELVETIINEIQGTGEILSPRTIEMRLTDIIGDALARQDIPEIFDTSVIR